MGRVDIKTARPKENEMLADIAITFAIIIGASSLSMMSFSPNKVPLQILVAAIWFGTGFAVHGIWLHATR